jgi:Carboxypeptidase regulatory-like domain
MPVSVIAASLLFLLQTAKGSIEGSVVNSVTNRPIASALVSATKIPGIAGGFVVSSTITQLPPARSDSNGRFRFDNLEPGTYSVRAIADGYAQQEFNVSGVPSSMTAQPKVGPGEAVKNIVLRLTPGASVNGRVTGSNGEGLLNMEVSLMRAVRSPDGRQTMATVVTAQTDDRGEYRLFGVAPGSYYMSVAASTRPVSGSPFRPDGSTKRYPRTFYPATTDPATAATIDVQPAVDLTGIDFRLIEQPAFHVRGRVVDSITGQIPRNVAISISARGPVFGSGFSFSSAPYNSATGTFDLSDVISGSYSLVAQLPMNGRPGPGQAPVLTAPVLIEVRGADVDGIILRFVPPVSISGRIRIEGDTAAVDLTRMNVLLRPVFGPMSAQSSASVNPDGTFIISDVPAGEYQVLTNQIMPGLTVKQILLGGADLPGRSLTVSGTPSQMIEIVLTRTGSR